MPFFMVRDSLRFYARYLKMTFVLICMLSTVLVLFVYFTRGDRAQARLMSRQAEKVREAQRIENYRDFFARQDSAVQTNNLGQLMVLDLLQRSACFSIGEYCSPDVAQRDTHYANSLIGKTATIIGYPFAHLPASGILWTRAVFERAGFIPKAYAQGIGFYALTPYREIWKTFRNIAFLLITLIVTVAGFVVMFNIKLGGGKSTSVQEILPKAVVVVIVIALSYPLVGFLIDIMYIVMFLMASIFLPHTGNKVALDGIINGSSPTALWDYTYGQLNMFITGAALYDIIPKEIRNISEAFIATIGIPTVLRFIMSKATDGSSTDFIGKVGSFTGKLKEGGLLSKATGYTMGAGAQIIDAWSKLDGAKSLGNKFSAFTKLPFFGKLLGATDTATKGASDATAIALLARLLYTLLLTIMQNIVLGAIMGYLLTAFIALVLWLSAWVVLLRLMFSLYSIYVELLVYFCVGPMFIVVDIIPGQKMMSSWFKTIAVNLAVFPLIFMIVILARMFMNVNPLDGLAWSPPFLGAIRDLSALQTIIGMLLLFSIPELINSFRSSMGVGKSPVNLANPAVLFASVGAATAAATFITGKYTGFVKGAKDGTLLPGGAQIAKAFGIPTEAAK